jgi:hypothetical protein
MGSGFAELELEHTEGPTDLFQIVRYTRLVTIGLEMHSTSHPVAPKLNRIVVARNQITHNLLSLPSEMSHQDGHDTGAAISNTSGTSTLGQTLYNLLRLSTLAFDLLVLFPLPVCAGLHSALAAQLATALEDCVVLDVWSAHPDLMLWSIILGGTMSRGLDSEALFASLARQACSKLPRSTTKLSNVQHREACLVSQTGSTGTLNDGSKQKWASSMPSSLGWEKYRDVCYQFLWYSGCECDGQGREFWAASMNAPGP